MCPNNAEVHVYSCASAGDLSRWEQVAVLREHDQLVCSLGWGHASRQLLSCSHDRNVYVWTPPSAPGSAWTPALVVHHLTRAALCCAWAPGDAKFAVGSGAGSVSICYFEHANNWWVGKLVKKHHGSSVLGLAWHPTQPLLATACADGCVRVMAAAVRGVDSAPVGGDAKFGDALLQWAPDAGWVHSVAWAPCGTTLACVTHGGGAHFMTDLDAARAGEWLSLGDRAHGKLISVPLAADKLPWLALLFISDSMAVAAGFNCVPVVLARKRGSAWALAGELVPPNQAPADSSERKSAFSERLASFRAQTDRGEAHSEGDLSGNAQRSLHMNSITCMCSMPGMAHSFSTSALDGRVAVWSVTPAELARAGMASLQLD